MPSDLGVVFIVTFVVTTLIYLLFFSCSIIKWNYQIHGRNCRLRNDNRQVGYKIILLRKIKKKYSRLLKLEMLSKKKLWTMLKLDRDTTNMSKNFSKKPSKKNKLRIRKRSNKNKLVVVYVWGYFEPRLWWRHSTLFQVKLVWLWTWSSYDLDQELG